MPTRPKRCGATTAARATASRADAALRKWAGKADVTVVPGLNNTVGRSYAAAAAAAKAADIAIVVVGLTPCGGHARSGPWFDLECNEGESHDRNEHTPDLGSLELPGSQQALVEAVAKANPNYVLVLINGGALGIDRAKANSPAIVEAFYPGESGGPAIIDVLDGSYNPTAKLPYTIYPAAFNLTRPITDMSLRGGQGITHMHYTGTPLWEFGSGPSYSKFSVELLNSDDELSAGEFGAEASNRAYSVRVTNTGGVAGGLNVIGFVTCAGCNAESFPLQRLFGFVGTFLSCTGGLPCGTAVWYGRVVRLAHPSAKQLSVADEDGRQWLHPAEYTVHIGGTPSEELTVTAALSVTGTAAVAQSAALP